ncbi:unnamed protein product [Ranitomeya imitator]|uniref:Uncharacterized protein n=1 Tax=Ranitomeya imitator TaxID=111125 RepID=A0ABN9MHI7_9NEOB|nr:unnamed protein product [Ranitomeya imitator]
MDNDDSRIRGTLCPSLIGRGNLYDIIVAMANHYDIYVDTVPVAESETVTDRIAAAVTSPLMTTRPGPSGPAAALKSNNFLWVLKQTLKQPELEPCKVKQGKEAVQDTANQCVEEGQKIAQEAVDKGCQAAKDAGEKAVDQLKSGIKFK